MADVFLLTKPPRVSRSELCFKLMERSDNAKLYLAGDGVYHLLNMSDLPTTTEETIACGEDILARGLPITKNIVIPDNFYEQLVKDFMENSDRFYIF